MLHALYELLRGVQAADDASHGALLREPLAERPDDVYHALLTAILRLVFLLYAEERDLLPEGWPWEWPAASTTAGTAPCRRCRGRGSGLPGYRLHPLTGDRRGQWSVRVSGNWRIVFRFEDGVAVGVTLVDYH